MNHNVTQIEHVGVKVKVCLKFHSFEKRPWKKEKKKIQSIVFWLILIHEIHTEKKNENAFMV